MVTQNDLIDLWVCEFTMDDYVEGLLQERDTEPCLQTMGSCFKPIAAPGPRISSSQSEIGKICT